MEALLTPALGLLPAPESASGLVLNEAKAVPWGAGDAVFPSGVLGAWGSLLLPSVFASHTQPESRVET